MSPRFFVYVLLNPLYPGKYTYENFPMSFLYKPFYVGKGTGNRPAAHIREASSNRTCNKHKSETINKILSLGKKPIIVKLFCELDECVAYDIETFSIIYIGRNDLKTGTLTNQTEGGLGGSSIISEETRMKLSLLCKNVPKTEEHKKKLSESNKGKHIVTDAMKSHLSIINTGKVLSDGHKKDISIGLTGRKKGPMKESTKQLLSQKRSGTVLTESHKENISKGLKAKGHAPSEKCHQASREQKLNVPRTAEVKEKLRIANTGKKDSPETIQKKRDAGLRRSERNRQLKLEAKSSNAQCS